MPDATPKKTLPAKQVTGIDLDTILISRTDQRVTYTLRLTWSDGTTTLKENWIFPDKFQQCTAAFLQGGHIKRFLQWLADNGFEQDITPQ